LLDVPRVPSLSVTRSALCIEGGYPYRLHHASENDIVIL